MSEPSARVIIKRIYQKMNEVNTRIDPKNAHCGDKDSVLKDIERRGYLTFDKNTPLDKIHDAVYDSTLKGMLGYKFLLWSPGNPNLGATTDDFYYYLKDYDKDGLLVNIWLFYSFLRGEYTQDEYLDLSYKLNLTKKEAEYIDKNEVLKDCGVAL